MITAPVLALPNFKEELIIGTDAFSIGLGVVLMQQGHLIAYINNIGPKTSRPVSICKGTLSFSLCYGEIEVLFSWMTFHH